MKPQEEKQRFAEGEGAMKKPRFKIEKLEERIAPGGFKHPGPHGGAGGPCSGPNNNPRCSLP